MGKNSEKHKLYQRAWRKAGTEEQVFQRQVKERLANLKSKKPYLTQEEVDEEMEIYIDRKIRRQGEPKKETVVPKSITPHYLLSIEEKKEKARFESKRWHHFNKGGTQEEWDFKIGPKVLPREGYLLLKKIEVMKGEVGLVDSFKLCHIYMTLFQNEDDRLKAQTTKHFSVEKELLTMYKKLKELI